VANYVLTDFDALERAELEDVVWAAADAAELVVAEGPARAMAALAKQAIGATA
jgi:peptidyl-tRNA hydrolase